MEAPRKLRALVDAVRAPDSDCALPKEQRAALVALGSAAGGGDSAAGEAPPALAAFVDKVARHAYRVTDEDVAALRAAGRSEEEIFEATVATAIGTAWGRMEAVLRALSASPSTNKEGSSR